MSKIEENLDTRESIKNSKNRDMLEGFKDLTELGVSMVLREIDGFVVPALLADKNLALWFLTFKFNKFELDKELNTLKQNSNYDAIKNTPEIVELRRLHREYKARLYRLEKSMYFKCEATDEIVFLGNIHLHEGKLVSYKYLKKIATDEFLNSILACSNNSNNSNNFEESDINKIIERKSKSTLESQLERGAITLDELEFAKSQTMTLEEMKEMNNDFELFSKMTDDTEARKLSYHALLERRIRHKQVRDLDRLDLENDFSEIINSAFSSFDKLSKY